MAKNSFISDFKAFAMKGNVVDMAVGVIIGGAFGKIVTSVVNDILMPPIGWVIGGVNFKDLTYTLPLNPLAAEGTEPATIAYGAFIQNIIGFIIIAFWSSSSKRSLNFRFIEVSLSSLAGDFISR